MLASVLALSVFSFFGPATTPSSSPTVTQPSVESKSPPAFSDPPALLNAFLDARIAGVGAENLLDTFLGDDPPAAVPLMYATTSGAPYERGEFEPIVGYVWPYGLAAFKVRLFAAETVVEQLLFVSQEGATSGLGYVPDGFGTDIAPTSENGRPVGVAYTTFDGEVTLRIAHPWVFRGDETTIQLVPVGATPTTDGGERREWDRVVLVADPMQGGSGCEFQPREASAQALVERMGVDPDLDVTDPVSVGAGESMGLVIDVAPVAGAAGICLSGTTELGNQERVHLFEGDRMRLYLFNAPEGSAMRVLAVAIVVPETDFERATEAAATITVEFSSN